MVPQFVGLPLWQPAMLAPELLCQVTGTSGRSLAGIFLLLESM